MSVPVRADIGAGFHGDGQTLYRVAQFRMKIAMGTQARSTGCRFALLLHIAEGDLFHINAWILYRPEKVVKGRG